MKGKFFLDIQLQICYAPIHPTVYALAGALGSEWHVCGMFPFRSSIEGIRLLQWGALGLRNGAWRNHHWNDISSRLQKTCICK